MKTIAFRGVLGYADRFAICEDFVYFVSVCGVKQVVESILSGILCGSCVYFQVVGEAVGRLDANLVDQDSLYFDDNYLKVQRQGDSKNRCKIFNLSRGRAHGFVMDVCCILSVIDSSIVIIGEDRVSARRKFNLVFKNIPVPYVVEWQNWYMARLVEEGLLKELICHNCVGYKLTIDEGRFLEIISDGVKDQSITF